MNDWFALWSATARLAFESNLVIATRLIGLGTGRGGTRELARMVSEKSDALAVAVRVATVAGAQGASPPVVLRRVVSSYRKRVANNRRRLRP